MQKRDLPTQYVLTHRSGTRALPLAAFFPLVITASVFIGMMLTNSTSLEEWRTPLLGIGGMSLTIFIMGLIFEVSIRWWSIRRIKQVYRDPWAVWLQYPDTEKWRRFVEDDYRKAMSEVQFSFAPIIIVGVIVTIIGAVLIANGIEIIVLFGLGGFMLIVCAIVVGEWLSSKWSIRGQYKRRKRNPLPAVLISQNGHYDEDQGYDSLKGLETIEFKRNGKKGRAKINFVIKARWYEGLSDEYANLEDKWFISVNVPKGYEAEAEALVTRFQIEVLI